MEKRSSVSNSLGYLSEEELREMYASAFEDGSGIGKEHSPGLPSSADGYEYDNRESSVQRRVKQIKTKIFENVPHKYEPRWDAESHEYEDYCEHCGEMPGNGQHKTAGSWPSDHHANEHLLSISRAMDEMAKGVKWHTEQGEPELAEKHRQALYALDNAHELMSKATVEVNDKKAGVVDFINRQRTKGLTEEFQSYAESDRKNDLLKKTTYHNDMAKFHSVRSSGHPIGSDLHTAHQNAYNAHMLASFANSTHLTNTMNGHDENNASHRQSANVAEAASAHANNLSNQIDD